MTNPFKRMLLAGACVLAAVAPAPAQTTHPLPPFVGNTIILDDTNRPSHRPLDSGIGDLSGAKDLLARRLGHTHDLQALKDIVQQGLKDPKVLDMLKDKFKDLKEEDVKRQVEQLQETIKKNPDLLDDPKLHDLLKDFEKFQKGDAPNKLPEETKQDLAKWAKDFLDKNKQPDPVTGHPIGADPPNVTHPDDSPPPPPVTQLKAPPALKQEGLSHEVIAGVADWFKDLDRSPEGEALRAAALKELAQMDARSPGASSDLADFLKKVISSKDAGWLADNLKLPSMPNLGGWTAPAVTAGPPSLGASSSDGAVDAVVWVAALGLLGAAAWMAFTMARRQAAAARAKAWSPGP